MRPLYFYRHFIRFTGGHLKVWDYFNHVSHSGKFEPWIYIEPGSKMDATNPWHETPKRFQGPWPPPGDDPLFLGGHDWRALPADESSRDRRPIINLIQHPAHALPGDERHGYLSRKAIRICVSEHIAGAIRATGQVNGPVLVIPNGVDPGTLPDRIPVERRTHDLCIVAVKRRPLGRKLAQLCEEKFGGRLKMHLLDAPVPRQEFLQILGQSRLALLLPRRTEGFYLPALEAMVLETLCICPDAGGNRMFCVPGETCLVPEHNEGSMLAAVEQAVHMSMTERAAMTGKARSMAARFTLAEERRLFLEMLDDLDATW